MAGDKLSRMRQGLPVHSKVTLRDDIILEVVVLPSDIMRQIDEQTEEYMNDNKNRVNATVRNRYFENLLVYHCLRDPDDPSLQTKVASSPQEIEKTLDDEDVSRVVNKYGELILNKSPKLEMLKQEDLDEIKKHLEVTPLNDLSTVLCVHLVNCHRTIASLE